MSRLWDVRVLTLPLPSIKVSFFFLGVSEPPPRIHWTWATPSLLVLGFQNEEVLGMNGGCAPPSSFNLPRHFCDYMHHVLQLYMVLQLHNICDLVIQPLRNLVLVVFLSFITLVRITSSKLSYQPIYLYNMIPPYIINKLNCHKLYFFSPRNKHGNQKLNPPFTPN